MQADNTIEHSPGRNARNRLYEVIFEADTPAGKAYDVGLLVVVALSVLCVMLDSVASIRAQYGSLLRAVEWLFTICFTIEYAVRLWCVGNPLKFAFSFFGIVDFLGVIPTYVSLLFPGSQYLVAIRFLRILRTFRVMKLSSYQQEVAIFMEALRLSRRRITVFLFVVLTLVVVLGSLMYVVEGRAGGFTSIPRSIYWAIVTLTTVGYGDISPTTGLGQALAAVIMIIGYSMIVVPTGIVSVAMSEASKGRTNTQVCRECNLDEHDDDAAHCKRCGTRL